MPAGIAAVEFWRRCKLYQFILPNSAVRSAEEKPFAKKLSGVLYARKNLPMSGRRKLLLTGGVGFKPVVDGERRRKAIRGNEITTDFVQINAQVVAYGEKPLEEHFVKPVPPEKAA